MKDLARMSVSQVLNEHDIDTEKKCYYVIQIKHKPPIYTL